jgi:hypothetical protein
METGLPDTYTFAAPDPPAITRTGTWKSDRNLETRSAVKGLPVGITAILLIGFAFAEAQTVVESDLTPSRVARSGFRMAPLAAPSSSAGTMKVATFDGPSANVVAFDGYAYFAAYEAGSYSLWRSDGTIGGATRVFADVTTLDPLSFAVIGNRLYFSGFSTFYLEATPTGIDKLDSGSDLEIMVYPNPFRDRITVDFPAASPASVMVYDLLCRTVAQNVTQNVTQSTPESMVVALEGLAPGVYFVAVRTREGYRLNRIVRSR